VLGSGQGRTKKAAEQQAAEAAWRAITAESEGDLAAENGDLRDGGRADQPRGRPGDKLRDKGAPEH
jgi:ribonuclease-3